MVHCDRRFAVRRRRRHALPEPAAALSSAGADGSCPARCPRTRRTARSLSCCGAVDGHGVPPLDRTAGAEPFSTASIRRPPPQPCPEMPPADAGRSGPPGCHRPTGAERSGRCSWCATCPASAQRPPRGRLLRARDGSADERVSGGRTLRSRQRQPASWRMRTGRLPPLPSPAAGTTRAATASAAFRGAAEPAFRPDEPASSGWMSNSSDTCSKLSGNLLTTTATGYMVGNTSCNRLHLYLATGRPAGRSGLDDNRSVPRTG